MSGSPTLFILVGKPMGRCDKQLILDRISTELKTWNEHLSGLKIDVELKNVLQHEVEVSKIHSELIIVNAKLTVILLFNPTLASFKQICKEFFAIKSCYRHIIYSGPVIASCGSWILQDCVLTIGNFAKILKEIELPDFEPFYVNAFPIGKWTQENMEKLSSLSIKLNPAEPIESFNSEKGRAVSYDELLAVVEKLIDLDDEDDRKLIPSPSSNKAQDNRYDLSVKSIDNNSIISVGDFKMLIKGDSLGHISVDQLNNLDVLLLARSDLRSFKWLASSVDKNSDKYFKFSLLYSNVLNFLSTRVNDLVSIYNDGNHLKVDPNSFVKSLLHMLHESNIPISPCYSPNTQQQPITLYHKTGFGTLQLFSIAPSSDTKEVKDFQKSPTTIDHFPGTSCVLVWQPFDKKQKPTRFFFSNLISQTSIFEGLFKLKNSVAFSNWDGLSQSQEILSKSAKPLKPQEKQANGSVSGLKDAGKQQQTKTKSNAETSSLSSLPLTNGIKSHVKSKSTTHRNDGVDKNQTLPLAPPKKEVKDRSKANTSVLCPPVQTKQTDTAPKVATNKPSVKNNEKVAPESQVKTTAQLKPTGKSSATTVSTSKSNNTNTTTHATPHSATTSVNNKITSSTSATKTTTTKQLTSKPTKDINAQKQATEAHTANKSTSKPLAKTTTAATTSVSENAKASKNLSNVAGVKKDLDKPKVEASPKLDKKKHAPKAAPAKKDAPAKATGKVAETTKVKSVESPKVVQKPPEVSEQLDPHHLVTHGPDNDESTTPQSNRSIIGSTETEDACSKKEDQVLGSEAPSSDDTKEDGQLKDKVTPTEDEEAEDGSADKRVEKDLISTEEELVGVVKHEDVGVNGDVEVSQPIAAEGVSGDEDNDVIDEDEIIHSEISPTEELSATDDHIPDMHGLGGAFDGAEDVELAEDEKDVELIHDEKITTADDERDEDGIEDENMEEEVRGEDLIHKDEQIILESVDSQLENNDGTFEVKEQFNDNSLLDNEVFPTKEHGENDGDVDVDDGEDLSGEEQQKQRTIEPQDEGMIKSGMSLTGSESAPNENLYNDNTEEDHAACTPLEERVQTFEKGSCESGVVMEKRGDEKLIDRSQIHQLEDGINIEEDGEILKEKIINDQVDGLLETGHNLIEDGPNIEHQQREHVPTADPNNDFIEKQLIESTEKLEIGSIPKEPTEKYDDEELFDNKNLDANVVEIESCNEHQHQHPPSETHAADFIPENYGGIIVDELLPSHVGMGASKTNCPESNESDFGFPSHPDEEVEPLVNSIQGIGDVELQMKLKQEKEDEVADHGEEGKEDDDKDDGGDIDGKDYDGDGDKGIAENENHLQKHDERIIDEKSSKDENLLENKNQIDDHPIMDHDQPQQLILDSFSATKFPRIDMKFDDLFPKEMDGFQPSTNGSGGSGDGTLSDDSIRAIKGSISEFKNDDFSDEAGVGDFARFCANQMEKFTDQVDAMQEELSFDNKQIDGKDNVNVNANNMIFYNRNVVTLAPNYRKDRAEDFSEEDQDELETISEHPENEEEDNYDEEHHDLDKPFVGASKTDGTSNIDDGAISKNLLIDIRDQLVDHAGVGANDLKELNNIEINNENAESSRLELKSEDLLKDIGTSPSAKKQFDAPIQPSSTDDILAAWGEPLNLPSPEKPKRLSLKKDHNASLNTAAAEDHISKLADPKKNIPAKNTEQPTGKSNSTAQDNKQSSNVKAKNEINQKKTESQKLNTSIVPFFVDVAFIQDRNASHSNLYNVEFFKKVRAKVYVINGNSIAHLEHLIKAKKAWDDGEVTNTTVIFDGVTYLNKINTWIESNEEAIKKLNVNIEVNGADKNFEGFHLSTTTTIANSP